MPVNGEVHGAETMAIILLGHGSRVPGAAKPMERVAEELRQRLNGARVYVCYLSRLGPNYPEVFARAIEAGTKRVIVMPYFLHEGLHILKDIPELMQEQARPYPEVQVTLGKSLGFAQALVELVARRVEESIHLDDVRNRELPLPDAYPVPAGQCEFVAVHPETAARLRSEGVLGHD